MLYNKGLQQCRAWMAFILWYLAVCMERLKCKRHAQIDCWGYRSDGNKPILVLVYHYMIMTMAGLGNCPEQHL